MSASSTVAVSNLAQGTTKQALEDFFSFCGTIDHVQLAASGTEAKVTFASSSAASNAAMYAAVSVVFRSSSTDICCLPGSMAVH